MARWLLVMVVLFTTGIVSAAKAPPISKSYAADKVADNVYVIHGPTELPNPGNQGFMNNPAIVLTDAGAVIIDPGSSVQVGEMVLAHVRKLTDKPVVAIFDTHVHGDHWLGNQAIREAYPDAAIYGHPNLIKRVADGAGDTWIEMMANLTEGATEGTLVVPADQPVDNGNEVKIGGNTFAILHTGVSHTDTDIMIHVKEPSVVFLGDNAGYGRILRLADGNMKGNIETLNKAIELKAKVYVPGHGKSGGVDRASSYRDYFALIYTNVEKYFEEDLPDFEMKPLIQPQMTAWHDWPGFEEEFGKHVNKAYLEIEEAAF
ncbi:MAG: MBL fold metallo-hydrolase [bacterium]